MKTCSKCGEVKSESEFSKNQSKCKECFKKYYNDNKENIVKKHKDYNYKNKEKIILQCKNWEIKNKEKRLEQKRNYRHQHKEDSKNYQKLYFQENKEKINKRRKEKYNTDSYFKFKENLRSNINQGFRRFSKNGKTQTCKNYGIDFEAIFNHVGPRPEGNYHLDHKIPLSVFDLDNYEHVRLAHIPYNLRWLEATENISKLDDVDYELIYCSLALTIIAQEIGLI